MSESATEDLPQSVKDRIEKNRQKAILLKKSKLVSHPYAIREDAVATDKTIIKIGGTKYKDTGGGFLLEESLDKDQSVVLAKQQEPPIIEEDRPDCIECDRPFATSWLFDNFGYCCCDECKDTEEKHKLITKTEALTRYILKDCDIDKREPVLKFIKRKNPHNVRWGDMKLYLELQVEKRALEIWESHENIEKEREIREEKRVMAKSKKYHKQLKELRMSMRSSLYDRTSSASHVHEFGEETYDEATDSYTKTCITCHFVETFEKM